MDNITLEVYTELNILNVNKNSNTKEIVENISKIENLNKTLNISNVKTKNQSLCAEIKDTVNINLEKKEQKEYHNFELKPELFTKKELELDPDKEVFIKFCKIQNDDLIKYFILKHNPLIFKCCKKGCPTAKNNLWKRKMIYLILHRKNNIHQDCRINNLELVCPNCYCQEYGSQPFQKIKKKSGKTCITCGYPIKAELAATQKYCYVCNQKVKEIALTYNVGKTTENMQEKYLNKIDKEYEEFMSKHSITQDLDLLNSRNRILIPDLDENDIFKELNFDRDTYIKAMETAKRMNKQSTVKDKGYTYGSKYSIKKYNSKPTKTYANNIELPETLASINLNTNLEPNIDNELDAI